MSEINKQLSQNIQNLDVRMPDAQKVMNTEKTNEIDLSSSISQNSESELLDLRLSEKKNIELNQNYETTSLNNSGLKLPKVNSPSLSSGSRYSPSVFDKLITWLADLIKRLEVKLLGKLSSSQSLFRYLIIKRKKKKVSLTGLEELDTSGELGDNNTKFTG